MSTKMLKKRISSHLEGSAVNNIRKQYYNSLRSSREFFANKGTQTEFRESESQTMPWEPPYKTSSEEKPPEVLTLTNFTWGNGLPAGMHELETINRMRIKKAWEKILPPMDTQTNIDVCTKLLSALEADSWAFREAEIQFIMDLRLTLAEKLMQNVEELKTKERASRFEKLDEFLINRKLREIRSIRNKFTREMRKLTAKQRKSLLGRRESAKYSMPRHLMTPRFSEDLIERIESGEQLPSWMTSRSLSPNYSAPKSFDLRICPRLRKRDEKKLSELYRHLETVKANLESRDDPTMPEIDPRHSADLFQSGRPLPSAISEGRSHYRELIERLQSARATQDDLKESRIREIMNALEGKTIAKMLIFLNEELKRLQNEKRAHATALLAERKKLAQSNRELMDNRRELDEMFRKILKINRDSVETYLEDIARGGSLNLSEMEAEKCIVEMSDKLDLMENYLKNGSEEDERLPESSIFSEVTDKRELDHDKTSDDLEDSVQRLVDRILVYAEVPDEREEEIAKVLKKVFEDAQKNLTRQKDD